jgi:hypothetical protein
MKHQIHVMQNYLLMVIQLVLFHKVLLMIKLLHLLLHKFHQKIFLQINKLLLLLQVVDLLKVKLKYLLMKLNVLFKV